MENKINIAKLLKDCPRGMELDCTMYEDLYFDYVDESNMIHCYIQYENYKSSIIFNQHGKPNSHNIKYKCVIFPKGKTTWEGFHRPFKDGDVVFYDNCISIFKEWGDATLFRNYVKVDISGGQLTLCARTSSFGKGIKRAARFATEEEKQKLFYAIKANGYKWNPDTKTLEKLDTLPFGKQNEYELVPNKFDMTTLKPFESRVLVRDKNTEKWKSNFWGFYDIDNAMNYPYECCGYSFFQCIPYEGNEHLLGKTDDCDDFYKTWQL